MAITASTGFGFNPLSALQTGAKGLVRVVSDPRAQQLVVVAGKAYAPDQTAQAQQAIENARTVFRTRAVTPGPQQFAPMPYPDADPDTGPPPSAGVQKSHLIAGAAIGGGLLLLVLLLRR